MKKFLIVVILFAPLMAHSINFYRCDKTDDCAKAYGGCGRYFSVHKRYKELYEAKAHKGDRVANCLPPTPLDKQYKAEANPICKKNRCLLTLKKTENEKELTQ